MTPTRSRVLAAVLLAVTTLLLAAATVLLVRTLDRPANIFGFRGAVELLTLAFALTGGLLALRRPENPIGWIFLVASLLSGVQVLAQEYTVFALARSNFQGARIANWIDGMIWVPITGSVAIFVTLLFPTGRPPSRRWRWVLWIGAVGILLFTGAFAASTGTELGLRNPFFALRPEVLGPLFGLGSSLYLVAILAALVSLVVRFRRSRGDERQQVRWFAAAVALVALSLTLTFIGEFLVQGMAGFKRAAAVGTIVSFIGIPVATGVAVLKYRLYDIDVVINRAVVFGALAGFITAVYVAIVVGIGALAGQVGGILLPGVAAAVVALAFHPVRIRAQHLANRLVYGKRATPYEVLSEFSERVGGTYDLEDVLPRMARTLGEGTGAAQAEVWLRVGDELRRTAAWPSGDFASLTTALEDGDLPEFPDTDRSAAVRHRGELLGALAVSKPLNEPITPAEEKLLHDLASHAGLVLRNVRLTAELEARLQELQLSRQRIVAAQDEERRRLERNIHDGAQQQLVALAVNLKLARTLSAKDPDRAGEILERLQTEAQDAMENLRDLARGIYPPLLADKGLAAALESQARKASIPVAVVPDGIGRYPQEAEAAAYFCVLEALQNVAKYAQASRATVHLSQENGDLVFRVTDDGRGFNPATTPQGSGLQNMADRVEALGGALEVRSAPGEGTVVSGRVPGSDPGSRGPGLR